MASVSNTVSKPISIPDDKFLNDTPSVAQKFLNEVKDTIMTLQSVIKHTMNANINNWSSPAYQEFHKIIKDEIAPIVNQVDARVQNFKNHFMKKEAKFVRDFNLMKKEADESLDKVTVLENENERLLRVVKFMGIVLFGNDHIVAILGYGNLQWGNILITKVYFVEGLGHNLCSVGQFCNSDLEVAFRRNTCFAINLEGVDLLKENRTTNLYTINLHEMAFASPICLMSRATSIKSWLWHQRLSHLNFNTINDLAKNDLVFGLPKFIYSKEHLCPSCKHGNSKTSPHKPKPVPNSKQRLHLLHMDLCGPMRVESINRKWVYNRQKKKIMETMNVTFDELSATDFEQRSSKPGL
nr:retrovirus-related Pol polyprotein from transposon TNT 1-94 [Tanacetum cinerariifolium]